MVNNEALIELNFWPHSDAANLPPRFVSKLPEPDVIPCLSDKYAYQWGYENQIQ